MDKTKDGEPENGSAGWDDKTKKPKVRCKCDRDDNDSETTEIFLHVNPKGGWDDTFDGLE